MYQYIQIDCISPDPSNQLHVKAGQPPSLALPSLALHFSFIMADLKQFDDPQSLASLSLSQLAKKLHTNINLENLANSAGLSSEEAAVRLDSLGKNDFGGKNIESFIIRNCISLQLSNQYSIVIGDLVQLSSNHEVPAEVRLISVSEDFKVVEAILTGDSNPQTKSVAVEQIDKENLSDHVCYAKSSVMSGTAVGIVYATGRNTAIGKIAALQQGEESNNPKSCCILN
jgi:hypothetical protein